VNERTGEAGFTLVEMMLTMVLLLLVVAPLSAAMFLGLHTESDAQIRLSESNGASQLASYFASDVQQSLLAGIGVAESGVVCGGGAQPVALKAHVCRGCGDRSTRGDPRDPEPQRCAVVCVRTQRRLLELAIGLRDGEPAGERDEPVRHVAPGHEADPMNRCLPLCRRARGEEGVALAWALAFLVVVGVIVFFVLGYADTSIRSTARLTDQRAALYGVDGAVNNAIRYVQNDTTLSRGAASGQPCNLSGTGVNGINKLDVSVTCAPTSSSGVPLGTSTEPGFAVLTMAPYHGQAPTNGCVNVNNELGLVQVQNSKLLQITGNVYVNSDADSDIWSGGCPQTSTAEHIQVTGNVRQAESCHDVDVVQPVPAVVPPYTLVCGNALAGSAAVGSFPAAPDPAIANPTSRAAS
jgi:hypothetical protein